VQVLCRCCAACTSRLRTCHAAPKGMLQDTVHRDTSKGRMTAVIVAGMWQAVGPTGILFQRRRGKLRGHVDSRPKERVVGKVARVQGGTETASTSAKAAVAGALLHCQPMKGCTWFAPCVSSRCQTRKLVSRNECAGRRASWGATT
jgi:hypothetical protein